MFTVVIDKELSDERIQDVLTGAFEGGSNYWYDILEYINPNKVKCNHPYIELPFIEGCGVVVADAEDPDTKAILNRKSIAKGLKLMANTQAFHFRNILEEDDDCETSDVLLQLALFGEVVFG